MNTIVEVLLTGDYVLNHKSMRTKLRNLKLVIVDEVSMVSSLNLTYMHMRLEELFNAGDKYSGAKNIISWGYPPTAASQ